MIRKNVSHSAPKPGMSTHPTQATPPTQWRPAATSTKKKGHHNHHLACLSSTTNSAKALAVLHVKMEQPCCPGLGLLGGRFCAGFWLPPLAARKPACRPTTSLQLHMRGPRVRPGRSAVSSGYVVSFLRPAVARTFPCSRTLWERAWQTVSSQQQTPTWCRSPTGHHGAVGVHQYSNLR